MERQLYDQLQEGWFRLLIIKSSSTPESDIECTLVSYQIRDAPQYAALSYTWGEPIDLRWITINGFRIEVRPSLESALRRFRKDREEFYLWADAVCINQESIPERNQQVAVMSQYYSKASTILLWLGEYELMEEQGALSFIAALYGLLEEDPGSINALGGRFPRIRGLKALYYLCLKSYWNRIWIIQEVVKAQSIIVHYGHESLDWLCVNSLVLAMTQNEFQPYVRYFDNDEVEFFEMISTMFTNGIGPLSLLRSAYRDPTDFAKFSTKADREVNPFQNLVTLTKTLRFNRKAEDSRDRIFALLGLVEPIQRVIADYGKPVNQVYTETTRELILLAQDLAEFWWISHNDEDVTNYPSWARKAVRTTPDIYPIAAVFSQEQYARYFAAGPDRAKVRAMIDFSTDGHILSVNAIKVDRIIGVSAATIDGAIVTMESNDQGLGGLLGAFIDTCTEFVMSSTLNIETMAGGTKLEAMWRTILVDYRVPWYHPETITRRLGSIPKSKLRIPPSSEQEQRHLYAALRSACDFAVFSRKLFVTAKGYLGLGPPNTRVGDVVFVLFGAEVPYILRGPEGSSGFRVIGDSYVNGIMDGEVMEAERRGEFEVERVAIK